MESGYSRKNSAKRKEQLLRKEREYRAGRTRKLNKSTRELIEKAKGKPLAREILENAMR